MGSELPEVVDAAAAQWTDDVDVLVVGCGMGGACAAVGAAEAGATVLVIERAAEAGGTSSMAGGHFYLGGGTVVQRATGHDDSPDEVAKYLTAVAKEPDAEKIDEYAKGGVAHCDWLESLGFEFERSYYPAKAVIQPQTQGLMYSGNEKVWPFVEKAVPAPRGHKVPVPGDSGGAKLVIDLLVARLAELNTEIRYETGARNLIVDDGDVVGVRCKNGSTVSDVRAKAVIVAAGGFVNNADMVAEHVPQLAEKPYTLGSTYDDGLGLRLGASVGAELKNMDEAFITAPVYPPSVLLTGIIVNKNGDRFVNEDSYHSRTSSFVLQQPDSAAYLIVNEEHLKRPEFPLCPLLDGYETVEEMESGLGIEPGRLRITLDNYNAHAANGEDPQFHKQPEWLAVQDPGPWAVFDLTLGKAMYAGFTLGGMSTTVDGQVRRDDGSVIPGLYAAGVCASTLAQDGKGYASGTQLGAGSFFGRRAGAHAARRAISLG